MSTVLTAEQARKVTGGRKPLVPLEYETATKALAECLSIDDAKYWSDKADALAAWARIYRDDEVSRKAKALKLHAYRRMGQLASDLRPVRTSPSGGPRKLLMESGLSGAKTDAAMALSRVPEARFEKLINAPNPISPTAIRYQRNEDLAESSWREFYRLASMMRAFMRRRTAHEVEISLASGERETAKKLVTEQTEWLDQLEQLL